MKTQDTIQIRIDRKTKEAARKTLNEVGLDMSSAVKLFLINVVNRNGIPLDLLTENGFTLAQEQTILSDTEEVKQKGKKYTDLDELFSDLEL
jgi:DNA-damage-inducible protein J